MRASWRPQDQQAHIRRLEGLARLTETRGVIKLPATTDEAANSARAHRKGPPWLHQLKTRGYALHVVQPSYTQLQASERLLNAQVHHVWWDEWSIRSFTTLSIVDDIGHWTLETTYYSTKSFPPASMIRPYHGFIGSLRTPSIHFAMSLRYFLATTYVLHPRSII